jgi:hypothetical protein
MACTRALDLGEYDPFFIARASKFQFTEVIAMLLQGGRRYGALCMFSRFSLDETCYGQSPAFQLRPSAAGIPKS